MLIDLPPGFESAHHAGDVDEAVLHKVSRRAHAAVAMVAIDDDALVLRRVLQKFLHIAVA